MRLFSIAALFATFLAPHLSQAQFEIQDSGTEANLRGIDSLGGGVAWASGDDGTVLRTEDGGYVWQGCAVPPGAEKLDFRAVQARDSMRAYVMSIGTGNLSRVYETQDGCRTWTLLLTNPDPSGFFDAMRFPEGPNGPERDGHMVIAGDPVHGRFYIADALHAETQFATIPSLPGEGLFAASNSSLLLRNANRLMLATGGATQPRLLNAGPMASGAVQATDLPMAGGRPSRGIFSIASATDQRIVAVGGDYKQPDRREGTAAFTTDGLHWSAAKVLPGGFRSSVVYDRASGAWLATGPNGTDLSRDNGLTWRPLRSGTGHEGNTAKKWNALSLPFIVGPKGRIGRLRPESLTP